MEVSKISKHGGLRQGSGRPKGEPTKRVRIPASLEKPFHEWLKGATDNEGVQRVCETARNHEEEDRGHEGQNSVTKGASRK